MSSIGPQLPSQASSKRKRTPESGEDSSASKQARPNADEINLDDDSDDDYGPRAPGPAAAPTVSQPSIGLTIPPSAAQNTDEIDLDSDSDDDTGPAPPPSATAPAAVPAAVARPAAAADDSDSDSDDDYGPSLPSAANARRGPIGPAMPPAEDTSAPTRDEWMLAPPTNSGYSERDPTKLKARKFTSKPGGGGGDSSSATDGGLAAIWTETPEEKLKRLQDAVLGRSDGSGRSAGAVAAADARAREEEERNRKIAASIAAARGTSLYEAHQKDKESGSGSGKRTKEGKEEEEEDDPSKRAFDREKDMALGSKISTTQRRELVAKSANFGGRFQKGSFL